MTKFRLVEKYGEFGISWELQRKRFYGWWRVDAYDRFTVAEEAFRVAQSPRILYDWHSCKLVTQPADQTRQEHEEKK